MIAVPTSKDVEFLIGSIFIDQLVRRRRPFAASKDIRKILAARRLSPKADAETLAEGLATLSPEDIGTLLGKYRSNPSIWSDRCAAGSAVLASPASIALMSAGLVLLARDVAAKASPRSRAPAGRQQVAAVAGDLAAKKKAASKKKPPAKGAPKSKATKKAISRLERWDDIVGTTTATDDLALELYSGGEAEAPSRRPRITDEDRGWIAAWTLALGHNNSGVRLEHSAEAIAAAVNPELVSRMRELSAAGDEAGAIEALLTAKRIKLSANLAAMLRRLAAIARFANHAFELPARSARAYDPVPGRVFYLVHMRDPYELNGYVVRTHFVLSVAAGAGFDVVPITRLGFPNDLARHRTAEIASEADLNGRVFSSLPDAGGGLLRRPIDEYVNAYADRIVELARERRPAAIHAASNYLNGLAAIVAARRLGVPCVYEVRGIWEITQASANADYANSLRYHLQRTLENEAVRNADRVVTISEPLRRFVIAHGAAAENVSVLPNGVDVENLLPTARDDNLKRELGMPDDAVVIGYIGSIIRYEGLDFVIDAMVRLKKEGLTNFRFLVVGDGVALPDLKAAAERSGVSDFCHFLGRVSRDRVEALYSIVDVAPFPRRSLPVTELVPPLKPYEAMACAKAVIVSSVAALAGTVIDGRTGIIVEKNNVEALSNALKRVIVDPHLRHRLGLDARDWVVKNRSVAALIPKIHSIYADLGAAPETAATH